MLATCFILPALYFRTTQDPVIYPRFTGLAISVFILVVLIWLTMKKGKYSFSVLKDKFFVFSTVYILISVVALFFAVNPIEGLTDLFKWMLFLFLTGIATLIFIRTGKSFSLIQKGVIINGLLVSLLGISQFFLYSFNQDDPNAIYEVKGLMAHKNQFSISLFVMLPFLLGALASLEKFWKRLAGISIILVAINILLLQTRSVWMALFVSLLVIIGLLFWQKEILNSLLRKKLIKRILPVLAVLIMVLIAISIFWPQYSPVVKVYQRLETLSDPTFASNEWRTEIWKASVDLIRDHPVIGVGGGNWKISIYPYYGEYLPSVYKHWRNPHNDYLGIASEKGLLGLIAFLIPFLILISYAISNIRKADNNKDFWLNTLMSSGIAGYMVIMLFSFPNERINHLVFIILMAAYVISLKYSRKDSKRTFPVKVIKPMLIGILAISYLAIHFGIICISSEMNMVKVLVAKEQKKWSFQTYYADKAYNYFAPIEPTFSFPVSLYQGLGRYNQGQFREALPYFLRAYQHHPTSISVMNNIGSTYAQLKQYDSAMIYYKKTIVIFSHYEFGLVNIAKTYYVQGDYEKAYNYILSCDPKSDNKEVGILRKEIEKKLNHN